MSLPVTLADGEGEANAFDGERLSCVLSRAFAPGAPVELAVVLQGTSLALRAKAVGSKRTPDDRFAVTLRLVNLRRVHREALRSALPG